MIADKRDHAAAHIKRTHAVGFVRHAVPICHAIAQLRNDAVGKALRQIEQATFVTDQFAIAFGAERSSGQFLAAALQGKSSKGR